MRDKYILTAESVTEGHPDKLCDTIADRVLDACLEHDPSARRGHHLAGHMGGGVVFQAGVQDSVRDGVAQLVRVALGDQLGGQNVLISHGDSLFSSFDQIFHGGAVLFLR